MEIEHFDKNLKNLNLDYRLNPGATDDEINVVQDRLGINIPEQVWMFYKSMNGLFVEHPRLEIFDLSNLELKDSKVIFSEFDGKHKIAFSTNTINDAQQWDIVNNETGYCITHSMASFWSNKIWAWLRKNREIWEREIYT